MSEERAMMKYTIRRMRVPLLVGSALLTALTLMFPRIGILEWVALVPFALVCYSFAERGTPVRKTGLYLLLFFGVYYFALYHWFLYMYPMEFLGISRGSAVVVVAAAWLGLTALQALPCVLVFLLFRVLADGRTVRKCRILLPLLAAALWTVFEWILSLTWAGVPWSRLALGQTKMRVLFQTSSLFGSYFVTFLIVAVNFFIAYALYYHQKKMLLVPLSLFLANLLVGSVLMLTFRDTGEPVRVAAIQGNISSQEKWDTNRYIETLEDLKQLTKQANKRGAQIVVWSETTIPDNLKTMPSMMEFVSKTASDGECYMLVGAFDRDAEGHQYNGIFTFRPDGSLDDTVYYKQHLVPFGEFVPMRTLVENLIPQLAWINAANDDLTPGKTSAVIPTEFGGIGAVICFDSIYEETVRKSVADGAELLVVSTNDSWFSDSVALSMHEAQSILRAVENGRWLVRAANTGISAVISPTGETIAEIGAMREWYLCEDVYMRNTLTLYSRIGNLFVLLCGMFLVAVLVSVYLPKRKKKPEPLK